jgi:uncharacterized protein (PEP-CTERM system associated)
MATAGRKCRAVAASLLLLNAAEVGAAYDSPFGAPVTPRTPQSGDVIADSENRILTRPWTVTPSITLRETYTDNVFIGTDPPRSDFVTQVTPGIRIDGRSPRLAANLTYAPSAIFYARNNEANDVANYLDAFARLEAVERFFFVEAAGNVNQSFVTPFAAQPGDITLVTQNRVETRTLSFSPYVRREGPDLEFELRSRNTWTTSDQDGLGDFRTREWSGHVAGPVRRFGWALEFEDTEITRYNLALSRPDDKARLYRGRLFYQPDPAWRLSVSAGEEENNYVLLQTQKTTIYGAGLAWRPGPRTSADLEYENRFFGPSRLARFNHRTRLTAWSVTYSRNTSTYQEEVLRLPPGNTSALLDAAFTARFPDPAQRRAAVQDFVRASNAPAFLSDSLAFYTQRVYLREGVDASLALVGARSAIAFSAFAVENSDISADALGVVLDPLLLSNRVKQKGFGAYAQHRLTPATILGANGKRIYSRDERTGFNSRDDYFNLILSHTVTPRTTAFAGASVTRFQSEDPSFVANTQDANLVYIGLNHTF